MRHELDVAPITGVMAKPVGDLAQSAVIQAARRAILSATSQIKVAKAERLPTFQLALTTGFLGGLTTFSTFSAEVMTLLLRKEYLWGMLAIAAHVAGSLALTLMGILLMRAIYAWAAV